MRIVSDEIRVPNLPSSEVHGLERVLDSYQVPYTEQRRPADPRDMVAAVVYSGRCRRHYMGGQGAV